nr:ribosomal protein S4 [Actinocyclus sp. mgcode 4]
MISLKKKLRFKLKYKTFKKLKTIIFNRKLYKNLNIKKNIYTLKKYRINQNLVFYNLYFPYEFFFKNYYKSGLITKQKFSYFYGSIKLKTLKKNIEVFKTKVKKLNISNFFHRNLFFFELFESRIDSILYRTYFVLNFKQVKFLICNKNIKVNNNIIKNSFFIIKKGDLITFSERCLNVLKKNVLNNLKFEFIPKNLEINYKTFQILYLNNFNNFLYLNNFNLLDYYNMNYSLNSLLRFLKA